jgi:hypothetical protein
MSVSSEKVFVPELTELKASEYKACGKICQLMLAKAKMLTNLLHLQIFLMSENVESG